MPHPDPAAAQLRQELAWRLARNYEMSQHDAALEALIGDMDRPEPATFPAGEHHPLEDTSEDRRPLHARRVQP